MDLSAIEKMQRGRGNLPRIHQDVPPQATGFLGACVSPLGRTPHSAKPRRHACPRGRASVPFGTVESARWDFGVDNDAEALPGLEVNLTAAALRDEAEWRRFAAERYEDLRRRQPAGLTWLSPDLFKSSLAEDLEHDVRVLQSILEEHGQWDAGRDSKVRALARLVTEEHAGEKVIVFSEYADTADYVGRQLRTELARSGADVHVEIATGGSSDPTILARRFSPSSNAELGGLPQGSSEVDVLIATDVLSEGQNLQDAAIVVNYDLPWTIIKIIQRAGRVDRVGQRARSLASTLPAARRRRADNSPPQTVRATVERERSRVRV